VSGPGKQRVHIQETEWTEPRAFAQATRVGDQLWIAGQVAVDADGAPVGIGEADRQAEQVRANLEAALKAAGGGLGDLVATTTDIVDRADRDTATEARRRWLQGTTDPTNTRVIVDGLGRPEYLLEVSAVAALRSGG
jgi:enamine deaminase RidA (YjgF/YER057c/UK114 family)